MANRLILILEQPEYSGLIKLAIAELRKPPDQLRILLRTELARRGLLPSVEAVQATDGSAKSISARCSTERDDINETC